MPKALLIICLVSATLTLISFLIDRRKRTKTGQRITHALAVISFGAGISSGGLNYWASIDAEKQLRLAHEQAAEAASRAASAQAQITEMRTPRRMAPETKAMMLARLKPHARQKYDVKVFRDEDSLELAKTLQTVFEQAGWVYTNVYPRQGTRHAETDSEGVWTSVGKGQTRRTSEAKSALDGALHEAGLYDDSKLASPVNCVKATGPIEQGTKFTPIPCSESEVQIGELGFTVVDDVIPGDTLVLEVGKQRL